METNRLKQFCVIVETGSLIKASELLYITHSALSKSMKLLQEEIGIALLRPSGRGITVTEQGLKIYERIKVFLDQENTLFKLDKDQDTSVRIGSVEIFLCSITEHFKSYSLQNNSLTLLESDPGNMEHMIANGKLDYGITYAPFPSEHIEITEIGKYYLNCFVLKNTFVNKNFSDIPFVVPARSIGNNPLGIKERDGWIESLYPRNKKYFVNLLSTAIDLTLQGFCAIYMPDFLAHKINLSKDNEVLVRYPLPKEQKNQQRAFLLKHKDKHEDTTFKQLFKIVKGTISCKNNY